MKKEEARKTAELIALWLEIRDKNGRPKIRSSRDFLTESEHSLSGGLLDRILVQGKKPLKHAPPLFLSRPWYDLIENNKAELDDMFVTEYHGDDTNALAIGQHQWHIVKKESSTSYVVSWRPDASGDSVWGLWRVRKIGKDRWNMYPATVSP